jgi:polysaccharide export outer membrane protein
MKIADASAVSGAKRGRHPSRRHWPLVGYDGCNVLRAAHRRLWAAPSERGSAVRGAAHPAGRRPLRRLLTCGATLLAAAFAAAQAPPPASPAPAGPAQASPSPTAGQPTPAPTPPSEYVVGFGDVLDVIVFDNPDLSRAAPVQTNGTITLPLLGDIAVADLTVPEIQRKIEALLARDYLVDPQVEVRVKEYNSQFVILVGEVNRPGRHALPGRMRLIDLLVEAGGFTPRASGELVITRAHDTFADGTRNLRLRLGSGPPTAEEQARLEMALENGDIITASPKYFVVVEGEVSRPGRYPLDEGLTASGAISAAGGLTRFGSDRIRVRRVDRQGGGVELIELNLKDVRNGKEPDLKLQANDVVSVSRKLF